MPPKDADKIKDAILYIDGKEIGKIGENTLPEIRFEKRTVKDIITGFIAGVVTGVCNGIRKLLLWIQRR